MSPAAIATFLQVAIAQRGSGARAPRLREAADHLRPTASFRSLPITFTSLL